MERLASYLVLCFAAFLATATPAMAADETWTVSSVAGAASVVSPMAAAHAVKKGEQLQPGATVTTGADGNVVFSDGKTTITVSVNSRITMPSNPSDTMTRFTQDLGSVFFKVEKRPMQHFEVQAPLVAAIVKGTQFTVAVGAGEQSVSVSEGLVEVVAMQGGQKEMVPAGRSVSVLTNKPKVLKTAGETNTHGGTGKITQAIGAEPLDYAVVTDGLVRPTPVLTATNSVNGNGEGGSSGSEKFGAAAEGAVAAVDGGTGAAGGVVADVGVGLGDAAGGGGVSVGIDAGAGAGGGGGVGVGVDVGAGAGGTGAGVSVGVDTGSNGVGVGIGVGVTGGTPPGQGGTPPGQSNGGVNVGVGVGNGGINVGVGVGGIGIGIGIGGGHSGGNGNGGAGGGG